jgi:hypothetical protein
MKSFLLAFLYVASFGPACWLAQYELLPFEPVESAFRPIVQSMMNGPNPVVRQATLGYASICGGEDTALRMDSNWWWENYGWPNHFANGTR